jgi:FkbM family methyltransferase
MLRRDAGYTGRIASFEPCAASFRVLSAEMAKDRQWHGYQFGLSDVDVAAVLNTYGERGDFNSLLHLRNEHAYPYEVDTGKEFSEPVQLRKVDTIWDEITAGIKSPQVFMKIDTQGHDLSVMLGAVDHLRYIHGIQSEVAVVEIYEGMTSMPDALKLYKELGYVPIGFYPVNRPEAYDGVAPEMDVVLKRFPG